MKKLIERLPPFFKNIFKSIAFMPTVIGLFFFFFALFVLYIENQSFIVSVKEQLSFMMISGADNARLILGTVMGGVMSLMVFSFSMVMVILSQASSQLSPRILPGLISQRSHQIVLGFYLGTIVYCLMLIININPQNKELNSPELGILFALAFCIASLGLFIYFIHSVSVTIQVDKIIRKLYDQAVHKLERRAERLKHYNTASEDEDNGHKRPDSKDWNVYQGTGYGYLIDIDRDKLLNIAVDENLRIEILVEKGTFVTSSHDLFKASREMRENEDVYKAICSCFEFYIEDLLDDDYVQNIEQLSEIALKALSPGINDPGTAMKVLDYMTFIFEKWLMDKAPDYILDDNNEYRVLLKNYTLDTLLNRYIAPIRHYGRSDMSLLIAMIEFYVNLLMGSAKTDADTKTLSDHLQGTLEVADHNVNNTLDRSIINQKIKSANEKLDLSLSLRPLKKEASNNNN